MAEFTDDIDAWIGEYENRLRIIYRKVALGAFTEVILMSPVDTGRFRGNWQCALNTMPIGTVDYEDQSGSAVIQDVEAITSQAMIGADTIYLVNNLPYARRLEYGWSMQAPAGMVRVTVQRWQEMVNTVIAQLKTGERL